MTPSLNAIRVLIVEDDAASASALEAFLRAGDYQHVGTVSTGQDAIRLTESSRPDLVIMDIVLPGDLDGIQTADLIRERFDIPVLYLTAYTDETLFERARVTAPLAYLTKPCNERDLKRAIEVALDRHALLQRIKTSEAHMAEAQQVAHFGSWRWDLTRDHVEASDELLRLVGLERGSFEPCLETFLRRVMAEDRPRVMQAIETLLGGEDPGDIDVRVPLPTHGSRVLRLRACGHFDADGKAFELVGTALDVTAEALARQEAAAAHAELEAQVAERTADLRAANTRMQAEIDERLHLEENMRASEARYRGLIDNLPEAVLVMQDEQVVFANPAAARLFGLPGSAALLGTPPAALMHPDYLHVCEQCRQTVLAGDSSKKPVAMKMLRNDGDSVDVEVLAFAFSFEGRPALLAVLHDLTYRHDMERATERFRVALDSLPDAVFLIDPATMRFIDVNEPAMSSLGYSRAELLALGPHDIKPHFNRAMLRRRFAEVMAGLPDAGLLQATHRRKDGSVFPVEIRLRAFVSETQPLLVAVVRDISERLAAEAQLREANERFQQLAENVSAMFWVHDLADGAYLYISPAYEKLFGKPVASLYRHPRSFLSQVHPDDHDRVVAAFEEQRLHLRGIELEYRIVLANNAVRWLWVRTFPIRDSAGKVYRIAGVAEDVTQRRASEEHLRNIIQTSMDGYWVTDSQGRLLDCNEASCRTLGYAREVMQTLSVADIEARESPADTAAHIRHVIENGRDRFETRHRRKDGQVIDVEISVYYQLDANSGCFHSFVRDITAHKQAEAARLTHEANQRDALVREVHHRIKNNLHGVIGLLRQHIADQPDMRVPIEAAINQINTISVVHGLQSRMPQKALRLRELLPEICNAASTLAMSAALAPVSDALRADLWLDSNASVSIALVLNELIQNALKHGAQQEIAEVAVDLAGDSDQAVIRICNPGTSLPPDFDFAAGQGHGTGLGLVRTLLPRHGAKLHIACDGARVCAELVLSPPVIVELQAVSSPAKEPS